MKGLGDYVRDAKIKALAAVRKADSQPALSTMTLSDYQLVMVFFADVERDF